MKLRIRKIHPCLSRPSSFIFARKSTPDLLSAIIEVAANNQVPLVGSYFLFSPPWNEYRIMKEVRIEWLWLSFCAAVFCSKGKAGMKGGMGGFLFAITHAPVSPFLPNSKCYTEVTLHICYGRATTFSRQEIVWAQNIHVSSCTFDSDELSQNQNPKIPLF